MTALAPVAASLGPPAAAALLDAATDALFLGDAVPLSVVVACAAAGDEPLAWAWARCDDDHAMGRLLDAARAAGAVDDPTYHALLAALRAAAAACESGLNPCIHCAAALRRAWQPPPLADLLARGSAARKRGPDGD